MRPGRRGKRGNNVKKLKEAGFEVYFGGHGYIANCNFENCSLRIFDNKEIIADAMVDYEKEVVNMRFFMAYSKYTPQEMTLQDFKRLDGYWGLAYWIMDHHPYL